MKCWSMSWRRPSKRSSSVALPPRALEDVGLVDPDHGQPAAIGVERVAHPRQLLLARQQLRAGGEPLGSRSDVGQTHLDLLLARTCCGTPR